MISPRFHRLLLALLAACFGAAAAHASVVQADLQALTRATSALVALNAQGDLQRSTDGGSSFTTTRAASGSALVNVIAAADVVIAVGDGGFVVRSANGGQAWSNAVSPSFTGSLYDAAANGSFWVAVGRNGSNVTALWSQDGGANWTAGTLPIAAGTLRGVTFDASAGRWTAVGGDVFGAKILTSTDGKNWSAVTIPVGALALTDVASDGQGGVLAVGEAGTLLVSANGGQTFSTDANSGLVSETLNVVVYSPSGGFVAGGDDLVQVNYTSGGGAELTQTPVVGGGNIVTVALDAGGGPILGGALAGYQAITFAGPGDQFLGSGSVELSATSSSGLPVSFELVSGPATLDGNLVLFNGAGTVVVRAVQSGNASFLAAASVDRSFEIVAATSGYEAWRADNFTAGELADDNLSGPNASPAGDGVPNLVKYVLGLPARTAANAGLPTPTIDGTDLVYTFQRRADANDAGLSVQVSTDLVTWTAVPAEYLGEEGNMQTWRARTPLAGGSAAFFRLRVTFGEMPR